MLTEGSRGERQANRPLSGMRGASNVIASTLRARCETCPMYHPLHRIKIQELRDRSALATLLPGASIGCELGVWRGDHASDLLRDVRPRKLHLVDNWSW